MSLFDYTRRARPWNAPKSLTDDQVYAVTAYTLSLNGIIGADEEMNAQTLRKVQMPNRDSFLEEEVNYSSVGHRACISRQVFGGGGEYESRAFLFVRPTLPAPHLRIQDIP